MIKKIIFVLCLILLILLVVWVVVKNNSRNKPEKYRASERDNDIVIYDIDDLEKQAQEIIPHGAFDYIRGGAETEKTMQRNISSFDMVDIYPRVLTGVDIPDIATSILAT